MCYHDPHMSRICPDCNGLGTIPGYRKPGEPDKPVTCPRCKGTGYLPSIVKTAAPSGTGDRGQRESLPPSSGRCGTCNGQGSIWDDDRKTYIPCPTCGGPGWVNN